MTRPGIVPARPLSMAHLRGAAAMSGYLSGTLAILCINLIFAYGIFVTAAAGQINLGGAGFQAIGAYATAWLASQSGVPMWFTIPAATLITALVGFLISFPVLRTRGVYMVLATFAFGEVVAGFLLRSETFGGAIGMVVPQHAELWVLIVSAVVVTLAAFFLMATRLGLAMRSINDDEDAAIVLGVNVRAVQVAAFTIGGAFAGLSGALYALNFGFVEAQYFNALLSIYVLLFVLIGGAQTAWGPLAGSLFFTILPELFRIGGRWRYVVFGVLIVLMMMVRPEGIVTRDLVRRLSPFAWRPRRAAEAAHEPLSPPSPPTASPSGSAASPSATISASRCPSGARMALIGPNGAGKTTLFNLISGVYSIDSGSIVLARQPIDDLPPRKRVRAGLSRSFQNIRLMPHLSVIENIMLGQHTLATRHRLAAQPARLAAKQHVAQARRRQHAAAPASTSIRTPR